MNENVNHLAVDFADQPALQDVVLAERIIETIRQIPGGLETVTDSIARVLHVARTARERTLRQELKKFGGKHAGHVLALQAKDRALALAHRNMRSKVADNELLKDWLEERGLSRQEIAERLKKQLGSPPSTAGQKPTRRQTLQLEATVRAIQPES